MSRPSPRVFALALCASLAGCGGGPASPESPSYDGQWNGSTSQGRPISFTVSQDQRVTTISVGYSFNGCTGMSTFQNLSLIIAALDPFGDPRVPTPPSFGPGFGYGSGQPDSPNYTQIYGSFNSDDLAMGSVVFGAYDGCGNSGGTWSASRR
jgi:hypothetical protein